MAPLQHITTESTEATAAAGSSNIGSLASLRTLENLLGTEPTSEESMLLLRSFTITLISTLSISSATSQASQASSAPLFLYLAIPYLSRMVEPAPLSHQFIMVASVGTSITAMLRCMRAVELSSDDAEGVKNPFHPGSNLRSS